MAIKVKLREKPISKGRKSLYLDFYPPITHPTTGKQTRREFLGLYIYVKARTPILKIHNTDTKKIAESIRQKRENFLNKPEIYNEYEKAQLLLKNNRERCFLTYFNKLTQKRTNSNFANWSSALKYLTDFSDGYIKI